MSIPKSRLSELTVSVPCSQSWDAMTGDDRSRYCQLCQQTVYNLSEMSATEGEALLQNREGQQRTCVRFFQRPDGTIVTADCRNFLQRTRRRVAMVGLCFASLLAGTVTLFAYGVQSKPAGASPNTSFITEIHNWLMKLRESATNTTNSPGQTYQAVMGDTCVRQPVQGKISQPANVLDAEPTVPSEE